MNSNTYAMENEKIPKLLANLAIPSIVAQIINLLYNIVDRIYIGHIPEVGAEALTGVGLFMPILLLINAFAMLAGAGGSPRAAILMGQKDQRGAENVMGNCFSLLLMMSVMLTSIFYVFAPQLLVLFGASSVTLPYAIDYSRIYILGTVFVLIVMGMNPFITTQGFAKVSMLTTVIGAFINIILDPIFIFGFDLGVKGAAYATVISQATSALWILIFLSGRKTILRLRKDNLKLERKVIVPCLSLGLSTFVMLATESVLSISFTSNLAKFGGDIAVGAMTIITSVSQLVTMPLQGICQGGQPIISYNYGANHGERVKEAFFTQFKVCVIFSFISWGLLMLLPEVFAGIFTNDQSLLEYAAWSLRIYMAGIFSLGFQICCQQSFMALGQSRISLFMACLRKIVLLIPLIYILPQFFENQVFGVFVAEPVSDIVAAFITTIAFMKRFNKILEDKKQCA